ncbi:MAG: twin-arginine translocase TatA/TatE family subunit [Chloroflexi bacterium]|nr:twin-arginine translocase TatA/TatE family subunit [Chloroflexota bacterium]
MDGIFGVGLMEVVIILLAIFIIGGPENTAKWARELGRWVGKARRMWSEAVAEMEKDLGPEGKELLDTTRQITQATREVKTMKPARKLLAESTGLVNDVAKEVEGQAPEPPSSNGTGHTP